MKIGSYLRKYWFFGAVACIVIIADQVAKYLVRHYIPMYNSITVIPGFFDITHVDNPGGAFGFMAQSHSPLRNWLFFAAALIALVLILYFFHKTPKSYRALGFALALIFGGAAGNLIDRLRFGEVVDYLDIYVGNMHWPTFNIADSAVSIGVVIFLLYAVYKKLPF